jgi:hypothetical protein
MNRLHLQWVVLVGALEGCTEQASPARANLAAGADIASAVRASTDGPYAAPSGPCDVVDLRALGSDVGRVTSRMTQTEGDGRPLTGCIVDLEASEGDSRFMLFVSVDSEPDERFARFEATWGGSTSSGYVAQRLDNVGTKAIYASRISDDGMDLDSVLGVLDANLYLEARFSGRGTRAWDAVGMRDGQIGVVGAAMDALAR